MPNKQTEARSKLAKAVAELTSHEQRIAQLDGIETWVHREAAEKKLQAARDALGAAQEAATQHQIAQMAGDAVGDAPDIDGAHRAVQVATSELSAAEAAGRRVHTELAELRDSRDWRRSVARDAAKSVVVEEVVPVANALGERVDRMQRELHDAGALLQYVRQIAPPGTLDERANRAAARMSAPLDQTDLRHQGNSSPTLNAWRQFAEALLTDPNAKAPKS